MSAKLRSKKIAPTDFFKAERVLWLGAHKTGTTFLQGMLDATFDPLTEAGVAYENLDEFRKKFTRPLLFKRHENPPAPASDWARGTKKTILFDENIPGLVQRAISRKNGFYPDMEVRLQTILEHLDYKPDHVFLGIRNLVGYLPSLYCETLKSTPFQPFESFMKQVPSQLQWYPMLQRLTTMFPGIPITIYRTEDLRGNERRLLSALTGIAPELFQVSENQDRSGFSKAAVRKLREISEIVGVQRGDVHRITRQLSKSKGNPRFDPFGQVRRTRFSLLYEKDQVEIAADPNLTLLDFAQLP